MGVIPAKIHDLFPFTTPARSQLGQEHIVYLAGPFGQGVRGSCLGA